jgi:hypothetical protein
MCALSTAHKTINKKLKLPYGMVQGIDQVCYALHAIPYLHAPH